MIFDETTGNRAPTFLQAGRHDPLVEGMKAAVDAGKLGALRYGHAAAIGQGAAAGRGLPNVAAGPLDAIVGLFAGNPVSRVFARECSLGEDGSAARYVSVVLVFADGSQAICEVGVSDAFAPNSGLQRLALTGMRGSAYFNDRDHDIIVGPFGARALTDDDADPPATSEDGEAARLAAAVAESLRTGQPVAVEQ